MTTLLRVPDQFTPGAGTVTTAATPTCCCCCCCVTSVVTASAVLAEGLNADLRQVERRSPVAVFLIALGPLIAIVPVVVALFGGHSWLRDLVSADLGISELVAVLLAGFWTWVITNAAGSRKPFAGLLRLVVGVLFGLTEFALAMFTLGGIEILAFVLVPVAIISVRQIYRHADRR
jgi:hypothetical protein